MKTNRFTSLVTVAFSLAAFSTAGCTEKKTAETTLPSVKDVATTAAAPEPVAAVPVTATTSPDISSAQWTDIKDYTYDQRAQLFPGLKRLEARVDGQISELTARRAAMTSTANTKDWDFAMKEMSDARSYLKSTGEELSAATRETWDQQKDKVGLAWVRTQTAYANVKASTTS